MPLIDWTTETLRLERGAAELEVTHTQQFGVNNIKCRTQQKTEFSVPLNNGGKIKPTPVSTLITDRVHQHRRNVLKVNTDVVKITTQGIWIFTRNT